MCLIHHAEITKYCNQTPLSRPLVTLFHGEICMVLLEWKTDHSVTAIDQTFRLSLDSRQSRGISRMTARSYLRRVQRSENSWESPRSYNITDNGWVLSPRGKRLLWLPHHWRLGETYRTWGGRFLGSLHSELPEAVILELGD